MLLASLLAHVCGSVAIGQGHFLCNHVAASVFKSMDLRGRRHCKPAPCQQFSWQEGRCAGRWAAPSPDLLESLFALKLNFLDLTGRLTTAGVSKDIQSYFS